MSERPSGWDGVTHDVDYSPHNLGRDIVTALCGKRIHVTEFCGLDPLTCQACRIARLREKLKDKQTGRVSVLSVGIQL
jgi:hypothetical protein